MLQTSSQTPQAKQNIKIIFLRRLPLSSLLAKTLSVLKNLSFEVDIKLQSPPAHIIYQDTTCVAREARLYVL